MGDFGRFRANEPAFLQWVEAAGEYEYRSRLVGEGMPASDAAGLLLGGNVADELQVTRWTSKVRVAPIGLSGKSVLKGSNS